MVVGKNSKITNKSIWQISREYAGIAEAGGVKNVCCSLAEELVNHGCKVTHFIPLYGCTNLKNIKYFDTIPNVCSYFNFYNQKYRVNFAQGYCNGVRIVFIINTLFTEKNGVYTYTALDEVLNHDHTRGKGHNDAILLDLMFQIAILDYAVKTSEKVDIIHCQDAATALIPFFARKMRTYKEICSKIKFVMSIHNAGLGYHHDFSISDALEATGLPEMEFSLGKINNRVEPFLLSEKYATITTVSPWYADEILNPSNVETGSLSAEFFKRNTKILGITNGIDYEKYNPTNKAVSLLSFAYNPEKADFLGKIQARKKFVTYYNIKHDNYTTTNPDFVWQYGVLDQYDSKNVYFSFHGRLVQQKGIDVLESAAKIVLEKSKNLRFIITGQGDPELEKQCIELANTYNGRFLYLRGYERSVARQCVAVADFLILPSYFEPCCLEDFIGQIFGTIPIAHAAGGLRKIIHGKTGFLYTNNTPETLSKIVLDLASQKQENPATFATIAQYAAKYVHENYSWKKIIEKEYIPLYLGL